MSQEFHLYACIFRIHRFDSKFLGTDDLNLFIFFIILIQILFLEVCSCLLFINDFIFVFTKLTFDDFFNQVNGSLLTCSDLMIFPFIGIVTSIFCLSFSTLKVTTTSVSGVKYRSSLPSLSSTAVLSPWETVMFFPLIINFIVPSPLLFILDDIFINNCFVVYAFIITHSNEF